MFVPAEVHPLNIAVGPNRSPQSQHPFCVVVISPAIGNPSYAMPEITVADRVLAETARKPPSVSSGTLFVVVSGVEGRRQKELEPIFQYNLVVSDNIGAMPAPLPSHCVSVAGAKIGG